MISEQNLIELEKLAKKHPAVQELLDEWRYFNESPYLETYLTIKAQIADWNEQLKIKPGETRKRVVGEDQDGNVITVDWMPGKIDLFADKDTKEFDRSFKYFSEITTLLDSLDSIRAKMTPEEEKNVLSKDIVTHKDLKKIAFAKTGS